MIFFEGVIESFEDRIMSEVETLRFRISNLVVVRACRSRVHIAEQAGRSTIFMLSTIQATDPLQHNFPDKQPEDCIINHEPEEVVDLTLEKLQDAGIMLIEWRSVLYHRMNVPLVIRNFSYLVPDESLMTASSILSAMNLPLSPPSYNPLMAGSDFYTKGLFHRITRWTSPALIQHFVLYPLSFSTLSLSELQEDTPFHSTPNPKLRCRSIFVPSKPAVYASIIRMMLDYSQFCVTSSVLRSELSSLVVYDLLGYDLTEQKDFFVDDADLEGNDVDERLKKAAWTVKKWGADCVWREGEEWIGDALGLFTEGKGKMESLAYS